MRKIFHFFSVYMKVSCMVFMAITIAVNGNAQNLLWGKAIKSDKALTVVGITADNLGNTYVIGDFIGKVEFGNNWPGSTMPIELLGADENDKDAFVAKYNASGECVFATQLGNPTTLDAKARLDNARAIAVSKDGKSIYVSVTIAADALGEVLTVPGLRDTQLTGGKGSDIVIVRYDQDPSDEFWYDPMKAFNIGTDGSADNAFSIDIDDAGDVYLCGGHRGRLNYNPKGFPQLWGLRPPSGYNFTWLAKYAMSTTKECIWFYESQNLVSNAVIEGRKIIIAGNDIYYTGLMRGQVNFGGGAVDASAPATGVAANTMRDIFLAKYKNQGDTISFEWSKLIGKSGYADNESKDLAVDAQNRVYVAGNINGNANLDGRTDAAIDLDGKDAFVARYLENGNYDYVKTFGSRKDTLVSPKVFGNYDEVRGMQIDATGNVYLTGSFEGKDVNLDPAGSHKAVFTSHLSSDELSYTRDAYVAKYNANGELVWGRNIRGKGNLYNVGCALTSNNIVATGHFVENCILDGTTELLNTSAVNSIYVAMYEGASAPDNVYNPDFSNIEIYADDINLYINNADHVSEIAVYNLQGSLIMKSQSEEVINIESLSKGIYLVRVKSVTNSLSVKIIK